MSQDPDLERGIERLLSHVELPPQEKWVPMLDRSTGRTPARFAAASLAAIVVALAVGVGAKTASDAAASRSPRIITTPPTLTRPGVVPSPSSTGSAVPRGSAVIGPAGTVLDFSSDVGSFAADDRAFAGVVSGPPAQIVVTELGRQKHVIIATRGREPFLSQGGALRGDLVAYVEIEAKDVSAGAPLVVWHVMVANWQTGAVSELDAIPGEESIVPHQPDYRPNVYTNGRDVLWLRTPRVNGQLGSSDLVLWRDGVTTVIWRTDWRSELTYALADDGQIAVVSLACPPGRAPGFCPTGTRWELYVIGAKSQTPRLVTWRDAFGDQGGVGGRPAFATNRLVWPRASSAPINVTSVDIVDPGNGDIRTVTDAACRWIGSTVSEVVFSCANDVLHSYSVRDATRTESNETGSSYLVADPHAIIGRRIDGNWVLRPAPD